MMNRSHSSLLLVALLIGGCTATAQQRARTAIDVSAYGVRIGYKVVGEAYRIKSEDTVRELARTGGTYGDYVRLMRPLTIAMSALDIATGVLSRGAELVAAYSVDASFMGTWRAWANEAIGTMNQVVSTLTEAGVQVPDAVMSGLRLVNALLAQP
jgi:hypothetical protein